MVERIVRLPMGDNSPEARLLYGVDIRKGLKLLPDASVHAVCTSPPYWGLRDYGTGTWEGGDPACTHSVGGQVSDSDPTCRKCGANRVDSQIGLESTPEAYVANIVEVFREVKRVLRPDGSLWVNLGDSYSRGDRGSVPTQRGAAASKKSNMQYNDSAAGHLGRHPTIKQKDLVGIPWMVAFALRADGWYLRSDIIWSKPNPMPESVKDRPTKSHEYVFLFAHPDSDGRYSYDSEAVREPCTEESVANLKGRTVLFNKTDHGGARPDLNNKPRTAYVRSDFTRNRRSVWTVNPKPYPGAHFATWPTELVETMIRAGSSEHGVCSKCGAPWARSYEEVDVEAKEVATGGDPDRQDGGVRAKDPSGRGGNVLASRRRAGDWNPTCACGGTPVAATVLDPFSGSATTGHVALRLGRSYVGLDLNEDYLPLAEARIRGEAAPSLDADSEAVAGSALDLFGVKDD